MNSAGLGVVTWEEATRHSETDSCALPSRGVILRGEAQVDRCDLTLALISRAAQGPDERYPLDRIRLQKAVFLLTRRGSPDWRSLYRYEPYNWGPYSSQLVADVDSMMYRGLVEVEDVPGSRYGRYATTPRGEAESIEVWAGLEPAEASFIRSVRAYVTGRSFAQLLREVYAAYPGFATASQFTG